MCFGSVQAFHTRSRGASKTRMAVISRSAVLLSTLFFTAVAAMSSLLLVFHFGQIGLHPIHAVFPETAIVLDPIGDVFERLGVEAAWPPLRLPPARDEAGALENFEVLGDGGQADVEGLGQL